MPSEAAPFDVSGYVDAPIEGLADAAMQVLRIIEEASAAEEDIRETAVMDAATESLASIAVMLAERPARSREEVANKLRVWRCLAPEDIFDEHAATPDERLLASLIEDIERELFSDH